MLAANRFHSVKCLLERDPIIVELPDRNSQIEVLMIKKILFMKGFGLSQDQDPLAFPQSPYGTKIPFNITG